MGIKSTNIRELEHLNISIVRLSRAIMEVVRKSSCAEFIFPDRRVKALMNITRGTVNSAIANSSGLTGRGVTVAVIDTGLARHPDYRDRIVGFRDLVKGRKKAYDDNGHGTHIAGIIAGNGRLSGGKYKGIAPEATLVGIKALNRRGSGNLSTVLTGLNWCLQNRSRLGIKVVNLSIGAEAVDHYSVDPLCVAIQKLTAAGMLVVAAAGNSGPSPATIDSPGCCPASLTVGAVNDRKAESPEASTIASFSGRGPTKDGLSKPDIVAPGVEIVSTRARSTYPLRLRRFPILSYVKMTGTSMSTPVVSGLASLLIQEKPWLSPTQLKSELMAQVVNLAVPVSEQGSGLARFRRN